MKEKIGRFMAGRYGNDKLNQFMMAVFLGCAVLNLFVRNAYASTVLNSWECLLIIFGCFPEIFQNVMQKIRNIWHWKTVCVVFLDRKDI